MVHEAELRQAANLLLGGDLVAFPTDTVYGVGAHAWQPEAVARLYAAKLRAREKAIPVLIADPGDLNLVALDPPPVALRLARAFWPGPLTLVLPRQCMISDEITAGGETVAVRVPDHPVARALIRAVGAPLATTSANLSGEPDCLVASQVAAQLAGRIAMILDGGRCPGGVPSTVASIDSDDIVILRPGPISVEALRHAAKE
jgi:L-threonylcarbamoyladenylate synthase